MEEIWKTIPNYDYYQASNLGRIKSLRNKKEKILCQELLKDGYKRIRLFNENGSKRFLVHRLILMTFCPVENFEKLQVNHLDENPSNNILTNLEWCTQKENNNYGNHNKDAAESNKIANPNKINIICLETKQKFISIKEAARQLKISQPNISKVLNKNNLTAGGYHFITILKYNQLSEQEIEEILLKHPAKKQIISKVMCIETQQVFNSIAEASQVLNLDASSISKVLNGKRKSCGHYHFKRIFD